jgi:hypothetical protein
VFIKVVGTSFTEMFAANDWKPFQSCFSNLQFEHSRQLLHCARGTRYDFRHLQFFFAFRFVNPIQNGQSSDSTDRDVRVMKKRSFILSDLLKGCMMRLDYNVLVPFLQPKYEYVLCLCLTDFQKKLYTFYLENYARAGQIGADGKLEGGRKGGLFYDVQNLSRVWNHPFILLRAKEKHDIQR